MFLTFEPLQRTFPHLSTTALIARFTCRKLQTQLLHMQRSLAGMTLKRQKSMNKARFCKDSRFEAHYASVMG